MQVGGHGAPGVAIVLQLAMTNSGRKSMEAEVLNGEKGRPSMLARGTSSSSAMN